MAHDRDYFRQRAAEARAAAFRRDEGEDAEVAGQAARQAPAAAPLHLHRRDPRPHPRLHVPLHIPDHPRSRDVDPKLRRRRQRNESLRAHLLIFKRRI